MDIFSSEERVPGRVSVCALAHVRVKCIKNAIRDTRKRLRQNMSLQVPYKYISYIMTRCILSLRDSHRVSEFARQIKAERQTSTYIRFVVQVHGCTMHRTRSRGSHTYINSQNYAFLSGPVLYARLFIIMAIV